jgi:hypothetical protein
MCLLGSKTFGAAKRITSIRKLFFLWGREVPFAALKLVAVLLRARWQVSTSCVAQFLEAFNPCVRRRLLSVKMMCSTVQIIFILQIIFSFCLHFFAWKVYKNTICHNSEILISIFTTKIRR